MLRSKRRCPDIGKNSLSPSVSFSCSSLPPMDKWCFAIMKGSRGGFNKKRMPLRLLSSAFCSPGPDTFSYRGPTAEATFVMIAAISWYLLSLMTPWNNSVNEKTACISKHYWQHLLNYTYVNATSWSRGIKLTITESWRVTLL